MADDKKIDLSGVDDIYKTPAKDEAKKLDLSGLDEIYNPSSKKSNEDNTTDPMTLARQKIAKESDPIDDDQVEAAGRGAAQGISSNFEPRIVGGLQALYHKVADSGPQKLVDLYNKYKELQEQKNADSESAYPKTYLGGQFAGGAAQMAIPGAGIAKGTSIANAALKTAALGGLSGLGATQDLTASPQQDIVNAAIPAAIGGVLGAGGKALANLANPEVAPQLASDVQAAFKQGQAGNSVVGPQASKAASKAMLGLGQDIQESLSANGKRAGQNIENAYNSAEATDANLAEPIKDKMAPILDDLHELKANQTNPQRAQDVQKIIDNIMEGITDPSEGVSPKVAKELRDTLSARSRLAKGTATPDTFPGLTGQATNAAQGVGDVLNDTVPGLADANSQYSANKSAQDLLKTISPLFEKQNLQNQQQIAQIIANAEGSGLKSATAEEFINRIKDYAQQSGNPDLVQLIEDKAPDIAKRFDLTQKAQSTGFSLNPVKAAKNLASGAIGTANQLGNSSLAPAASFLSKAATSPAQEATSQILGRTLGGDLIQQGQPKPPMRFPDQSSNNSNPNETKPLQLSKDLYSANDDQLRQVTSTLAQDPSLKSLSTSLSQAIENNDNMRKNTTLFALLQNPRARQLIYGSKPDEA